MNPHEQRIIEILAQLPPDLYERFLAYGRGMLAALDASKS